MKKFLSNFPRLSKTLRAARDTWNSEARPSSTKNGYLFSGSEAMIRGDFEPLETELANKILDDSNLFINVGANIGYYCCMALSKNIETYAFEPIPLNANLLMRNVYINNWQDNLHLFPLGLSNKHSIMPIYGAGTGASFTTGWANIPESFHNLAPCVAIDEIDINYPSKSNTFIIVDVENHELVFLLGAQKLLNKAKKPIWMVEICIDEHQPTEIVINPALVETFEIFLNKGYECRIVNQEIRKIEMKEIRHIEETQANHLDSHNFLFADPEFFAKNLPELRNTIATTLKTHKTISQ